ncbi:MAG TPA: cytochrome P450 [Mycobacterium sp.]|nr:cytochrome P450 [Mycobacterium sp.]
MTQPPPCRLTDPELHATGDPHPLWAWMREHAPVYWNPPGELPGFWSVTRYDDVRNVYRNPRCFSSAHGVLLRPNKYGDDPGGGLTLALTDPPRHRELRALLLGSFSKRSAQELQSIMLATVRAVVARALQAGECDFAHDVAAYSSISLICRLLGSPASDHERVFRWTGEAFAAGKPLTAHQQLIGYFIDLMYERIEEPRHDAMTSLALGTVEGELLTEKEILLNVENLVGATENAGLSIASGMLAFLERPAQWERLRDNRDLLGTAVEEVLRWTSSATHSMRTVAESTKLRDRSLAVGDRVVLWLPSANRDDAVFADPHRFDVARQPNRHLAMGSGDHLCIGSILARAQMRMLFNELLDATAGIEQCGPAVPVRSIAVSGPKHLPVRMIAA